ncbi:MAG: trypsin-like peptidase domain-containing protein [Desulfovibrionaceae bacterium]|nr:trypsin-like peptidase domain-containing protein [Desulfovibrionaceae bacterium]
MLCPKCHKTTTLGGKFCEFCGAPLSETAEATRRVTSAQIYTVGRDKACDVVFSDNSVSRKHCTVEKLPDGTYLLRDLGSSNGTFVDGVRVSQKHISATSRIRLGTLDISGADILQKFADKGSSRESGTPKKKSFSSKKRRVFIALFVLFVLFLLWPSKKDDDRAIESATVLVIVETRSGDIGTGTGFFVNKSTVITNRHVVENAKKIVVANRIVGDHTARLIAVAKGQQNDFAALDLGKDIVAPLALATEVSRNEKVYAWGYPGLLIRATDWEGLPDVVSTSGEVNLINNGSVDVIIHSATISQGNSGGPLVNEKGYVVGINTWVVDGKKQERAGEYGMSISSADIINFLKSYGIKYKAR